MFCPLTQVFISINHFLPELYQFFRSKIPGDLLDFLNILFNFIPDGYMQSVNLGIYQFGINQLTDIFMCD